MFSSIHEYKRLETYILPTDIGFEKCLTCTQHVCELHIHDSHSKDETGFHNERFLALIWLHGSIRTQVIMIQGTVSSLSRFAGSNAECSRVL